MSSVRQAHMPGNYELYDESSNRLGPVICKDCWEKGKQQNSSNLQTVWVSVEGRRVVWWLCQGHAEEMRGNPEAGQFLKSAPGIIVRPEI